MSNFVTFTKQEIVTFHTGILSISNELDRDGILNPSSLDAALSAPMLTFGGTDIYPDVLSKIGALMFEIITLHPFVEGNKRTGFLCADMLMILNDRVLIASDEERTAIAISVAKMETDRESLIAWLRIHSIETVHVRSDSNEAADTMGSSENILEVHRE